MFPDIVGDVFRSAAVGIAVVPAGSNRRTSAMAVGAAADEWWGKAKGDHRRSLNPEGLIPCLRNQAVPGPVADEIRETREMQMHAGNAQSVGSRHVE